MRRHIAIAVIGFSACGSCLADAPLPPPEAFTTCSPSKSYCVDLVPDQDAIAYRVGPAQAREAVWRLPGWHRASFVSDDGIHFASCYGGLNLIPERNPDMVIIQIFERGRLAHSLALKALVSNPGALPKTVSHYVWGICEGLSRDNKLRVHTVEQALSIDLSTGEAVPVSAPCGPDCASAPMRSFTLGR